MNDDKSNLLFPDKYPGDIVPVGDNNIKNPEPKKFNGDELKKLLLENYELLAKAIPVIKGSLPFVVTSQDYTALKNLAERIEIFLKENVNKFTLTVETDGLEKSNCIKIITEIKALGH